MSGGGGSGFSAQDDDLRAVEIEGLAWLVNSPKVSAVVIDQRGYPLSFSCPDPRAFALHKLWLSRGSDRDAAKRSRDAMQARVVAELIGARLPRLRYDSDDLRALPLSLRRLTAELNASDETGEPNLTPNW